MGKAPGVNPNEKHWQAICGCIWQYPMIVLDPYVLAFPLDHFNNIESGGPTAWISLPSMTTYPDRVHWGDRKHQPRLRTKLHCFLKLMDVSSK